MARLSSTQEIPPGDIKTKGGVPGQVVGIGPDGNCTFISGGGGSKSLSRVSFVAVNGSDSVGDGSINAPYATYNHAAAVALAATPVPSDLNPWLVVFAPGTYAADLTIEINVGATTWAATGGEVIQTGHLTPGATFASGTSGTDAFISNMLFQGDFTANLNTGFSKGIVLYNCDFEFGTVSGSGGGAGFSDIYPAFCEFANGASFSDLTLDADGTNFSSLTLSAINFNAELFAIGNASNITQLILNGNDGHTCATQSQAPLGFLTLNGTLATYIGIIGSIPYGAAPAQPVLTGGATLAQYTILGTVPTSNLATSKWVSLAAGGTLAPSPTQTKIVFDTTGAAGVVNLPASGTAADGEEHLVKGRGATTTGSMTVNAGAGNTIESYASPGTFSGSGGAAVIAAATHAGWIASWKYQLSTTEWILQGIY
jgi:hypothetical protein